MYTPSLLQQKLSAERYRPLICLVAIPGLIVLAMLAWSSQNDTALMLPSTKTMHKKYVYYRGKPLNDDIGKNVCSIKEFNKGQWEYEPINSKDQKSFEKETGYHCHKKFPHQCYNRNKFELDRNRHM